MNRVVQLVANNTINKKKMKTIFHSADSRGHADHGWLKSYHSFSFANYYNPDRMHFGVLRVLNDDTVTEGKGFGTHPHKNMEIISIPLEGDLEHKDSMGNTTVIKEGDVQVMSAGTGVYHSEYNKNANKSVKFLQIWVFPNKENVVSRYDQIATKDLKKKNELYQIVSPKETDQGVWLHQDAWFYLGNFDAGQSTIHTLHKENNGVYVFILDGEVEIAGQTLERRDGFGVWDTREIGLKAIEHSRILLIEVPME